MSANDRTVSYPLSSTKRYHFLQYTEPMVTKNTKQSFSNRLNAILDAAGIPPKGKGRQKIVGDMFGVTQKGARKWLEGEAIPAFETLTAIARKFEATGVTAEWLLTGNKDYTPAHRLEVRHELNDHGIPYENPAQLIISGKLENRGNVPLISAVSAGCWCEATDNYAPGDAEEWLPCPDKHGPHTYALRVIGDSMTSHIPGQRSYPEGCVIYVDPDKPVTNGSRVIAKLPNTNEVTFKEYREDSGKKYLKPINTQYSIQEISADTLLCGVVIGKYEPE